MTRIPSQVSDPLALLSELVAIRSVFPGEQEISARLELILRGAGFRVEKVRTADDRFNLVATYGSADRYLGFYGHMDTVPPAIDYVRDPFQVEIDGNIARGLGVVDMKGGLSCIVCAAAWAVQEKLPVKVIFGVDEEEISLGAHDLVSSGTLSDVGFLIVAESGQVQDYAQPLSVCLGRNGRIVYNIEVRGKAAHAADAHKGVNAIEKAAQLISAIAAIKFVPHPKLGPSSVVTQKIQANTGSFSVPDRCEISISLLNTPNLSSVAFEQTILKTAAALNIEITVSRSPRATPYGEAYEIDLDNGFLGELQREIFVPLGVRPIYTASVADENVFAHRLGIPVLTVGPIGDGDHTKDEWVNIQSLATLVESYKRALVLFNK